MAVRTSKEVVDSIFGSIGSEGSKPEAVKTLEMLTVRDVMERRFIALNPQTTIMEAVEVFTEKGIESAPIVQDGVLKGILTNQDIIKLFEEKSIELSQHRHKATNYEKEFRALGGKKVGEIVRHKVFVFPNTTIFDAMTVLDENNMEAIVVVDETGKVQGVVKDSDMLKIIMKVLV